MDPISVESILFGPHRRSWTAGALLAIVVVGLVDYFTGPEITFSVLYLIPVATAAWLAGTRMAVAAAALAAFVWLCAEVASSRLNPNLFVYSWNFCARLLFLLLVALLLAQLRQMLGRERELSRSDPLTRLPNSRAFREFADVEIARSRRYGHPLTLAFIDIDDFKRVNDRRGHVAGDKLLRRVGEIIRANVRSSDLVARFGGDEFVVMFPVADSEDARIVVNKLRAKVREAMANEATPVTLSIGVVTYKPGEVEVTVDGMLENADRLMYDVKSNGKADAQFATVNP